MYLFNNSYANFKFELIDTLLKINPHEFDYTKDYDCYKNIFKDIVKDKCNDLNNLGIDRLRAAIAKVRPDLRFRLYSTLFNMEDFYDMLYWVYLDDMFKVAMWKRVSLTKNWW